MTQAEALDILKTGANVFLTGEPGSGKSHTVQAYTTYLRSQGVEPSITASTGIAATHVGGMTIHAWSGIGVSNSITEYEMDAIAQKEKVVRRVTQAKVLIIDEISMLSMDTLDSVDLVCRTLRGSNEAFGGMQVVFVGDFFQLPPIVRAAAPSVNQEIMYEESLAPFAFRAGSWKRAKPLVCYLHEQHRQEDARFLELLSYIRRAEKLPTVRTALSARMDVAPSRTHTKLFSHNANVDTLNEQELRSLGGVMKTYTMESRGAPALIETLKRNCLSPEALQLKIGAKVMFTKNDPDGEYYNGSLGVVTAFSSNALPVVTLSNKKTLTVDAVDWSIQDGGKPLATVTQLPLRLAWAMTVHKSQGMSLDAAVIDLARAFEYGQGYVALSRVRSLEGLFLLGLNERSLEVHPEVLIQDEAFREQSDTVGEAFEKLPAAELKQMHDNFLRICAGGPRSAAKTTPSRSRRY